VVAVLTGWQPAGFWYSKGNKSFMATISRADLKKLRKRRARLKKKKMSCQFTTGGVVPRPVYVDYKDLKTLRTLIDREGRILPRRRTGTTALFQRAVRKAVLRARFIGLLPFVAEE
jgi:small subunit ribosomal protein S18